MKLNNLKIEIGYDHEWEYFVPQEFFQQQLEIYQQEKRDGAVINKEHYKWAAYRYILEHHDLSSIENWSSFVDLIHADPDEHLFKGVVSELINSGKINVNHFSLKTCPKLLRLKIVRDLISNEA